MKQYIKYCFFLALFFGSCTPKDKKYHTKIFAAHKKQLLVLGDCLSGLLNKSDSIYKYEVEFTGKRLVEYSYIGESKEHYFKSINLSPDERALFENTMYDLDLQYVIGYRDRIEYVFSGWHKDVFIRYRNSTNMSGGVIIDTNTYIFPERNS